MLMVLAACLVVLSLSSYRAADLEILLHEPSNVTATATPDGRTLLVSVLDPSQRTRTERSSRQLGAHGDDAADDDAASARSGAETKKAPATNVEERAAADELVGPPAPAPVMVAAARDGAAAPSGATLGEEAEAAAAASGAARATKLVLLNADELVGPPMPSPRDLAYAAAAARDELVGPPEPTAADLAIIAAAAQHEDALVGPPLPDDWRASPGVVLASAIHPPLTFGHLAVGPFRQRSSAGDRAAREQSASLQRGEFEEFLAPADDGGSAVRAMRHKFKWGETLSQVLGKAGVGKEEVDEWIRATNEAHDVDRVYAGQELELMLARSGSALQRLRMEIDAETVLVVERQGTGVIARKEEIPYDRTLRVVGSEIRRSLYETAQAQNVPEKIIADMAEILGWDVDLATDVEPGATFRVVYEELTRPDSRQTIPGRLLAVDLTNRGKRHEGFYFAMPDGKHAGYYDRGGRGIGRGFLRFPVAFTRISSNFSTARFHPILKRSVPHYGVDFAAPPGTPVKAVADGRVLKAGWYGGNGKFVKVQHDATYETGYSHLSSIAPSVRAGGTVKQGQVIGYVGSTGLATGPHLHFAMYRGGKYVDPLKADLPRTRSLLGKELAAFRMRVDMMDRSYANAGVGEPVPTQMAADFGIPVSTGGGGQ